MFQNINKRYFNIPVHLLYTIDFGFEKKNIDQTYVTVETKDFRKVRFVVYGHNKGKELFDNLHRVAFPNFLCKDVFALKYQYLPKNIDKEYRKKMNLPVNGWEVYDMIDEFKRQGVASQKTFRLQNCWYSNDEDNICQTYPLQVFVPSKMTPIMIASCAEFRHKNRFPALSFYHKTKGSSLWRSSQNSPGVISKRSEADEMMIKQIGFTNPYTSSVIIYDARSKVKAYSNRIKGGGYENTDYYSNCCIKFCSIDNIFGVAHAYTKLFNSVKSNMCLKTTQRIYSAIEESGWYSLISTILKSVNEIVEDMDIYRKSVLVHCSDGWDRTAQIASLTQIILDPYARTLRGFEVVLEKEFLSFGHSFESRCGHLCSEKHKNKKRSPVFVQFLDCVYQLVAQFPTKFQFNVNFLCFIAYHTYSCKFGTFLLDTQKYRTQNMLSEKTVSIWTYINDNVDKFINPFFDGSGGKLEVKYETISLKFWKEYFLKWTDHSLVDEDEDSCSAPDPKDELMRKLQEENSQLQHLSAVNERLMEELKKFRALEEKDSSSL